MEENVDNSQIKYAWQIQFGQYHIMQEISVSSAKLNVW